MNRRGHVPTILLVLVALVFSCAALLSFFSSGKITDTLSRPTSAVLSDISLGERHIETTAVLGAQRALARSQRGEGELVALFREEVGARAGLLDSSSNFFGKVRNADFSFEVVEGGYKLTVEDIFVQSSRGTTKIVRYYTLVLWFDSQGQRVYRA